MPKATESMKKATMMAIGFVVPEKVERIGNKVIINVNTPIRSTRLKPHRSASHPPAMVVSKPMTKPIEVMNRASVAGNLRLVIIKLLKYTYVKKNPEVIGINMPTPFRISIGCSQMATLTGFFSKRFSFLASSYSTLSGIWRLISKPIQAAPIPKTKGSLQP